MSARNGNNAKKGATKLDWRERFLDALEAHPDVTKACRIAGINRTTAYRLRHADEDFALAWADAHAASLDRLEAALFQRAEDADTTAAIFLLKSHRPDTYADRQRVEHSGRIAHDVSTKSDDELRELAALLDERADAR